MAKGIFNKKIVRRLGGKILRLAGVDYNKYQEMQSVRAAKMWLRERSDNASVAIRDGWALFYDPGNTLIKRGPYYEPDTREALFALCAMASLRDDSLSIADIGANIGLHTVFLARRFPDAVINAYDPSPQSVRYLRRTIEYNGLDQVHLHECALGANEGFVEFHTWGSESSADSLRDTKRVSGATSKTISVPLKTLDKQLSEGVRPNVIKMDCEGGELDVLRGAKELFLSLRPLVLTEFSVDNIKAFGVEPADLFKWAEEVRYKVYTQGFAPISCAAQLMDMYECGEENFVLLPSDDTE